jgi:hypothetical protein
VARPEARIIDLMGAVAVSADDWVDPMHIPSKWQRQIDILIDLACEDLRASL